MPIRPLALAFAFAAACGANAQTGAWHGPDAAPAKPPAAAAPPAEVLRRFQPPLANGMTVDNCETWSKNCGEPGAHAFCRSQGYGRALQWEFNRPGRTWVLGSNRACEGEFCVGFTYVVCSDKKS
ncbi:MAG TPA: hypothetical protein VI229_01200 [Burkholderiales bacterium]